MWTANAVGSDATTQAAAGAAGSDGGRAVEPWATEGFGADTIGCQLTRCGSRTWPLMCRLVARTSATGATVLAGCPYRPGSRRQNGVSATEPAVIGDQESKPRGRRGAKVGYGLEQSPYERGERSVQRGLMGRLPRPIILKSLLHPRTCTAKPSTYRYPAAWVNRSFALLSLPITCDDEPWLPGLAV